MTLLGENGVPKQFDLSPTVLASGLVATIGLLLTVDFGMIEAKSEQDSFALTASLSFVGMTLHDKNGKPRQSDLSPKILTSGFIATIGLLLTANFGMIEATL